MIELLQMIKDQLTRREVLVGMAAASLFTAPLQCESAASSLCFMSAVEMAQLIRAKKLSAREALAEHLIQIDRVRPGIAQQKLVVGRERLPQIHRESVVVRCPRRQVGRHIAEGNLHADAQAIC